MIGKKLSTLLLVSLTLTSYPSEARAQNVSEDVVINVVGDVHNERPVKTEEIITLKNYLIDGDLNILNLETAITSSTKKEVKKYNFKSDPVLLDMLLKTGFNLFSIANNHSYDYGLNGFKDTLKQLEERNINYVGGGYNKEQSYAGKIIEIKGIKFGILSFAKVNGGPSSIATETKPGITNGYDEKSTTQAIKNIRSKSDIVIVITHWGEENKSCPRKIEINTAKKWQLAGADIILGSHPHVLQPVILNKNKLIAYSLGNFIFYSNDLSNRETGILKIKITPKKEISYSMNPFIISMQSKIPAPSQEKLLTPKCSLE
jgi:poly-gamma-glutamate synthesis protein (capsule biosynthesis protein)